jgi:mono/diheme cytochrome c family protein
MSQKPKRKRPPHEARTATEVSVASPASVRPAATVVATVPADDFEPQTDTAAMPFWLFIALIVLAYWGMLHLDQYGGGFNERVYAPYSSFRQLADLQPKSGPEMLAAKGESIYTMVCVACHQSSGVGSANQYPPLVGSEWVLGSPSRLIRIPLHGLSGPIQVKGQTWTGLSMPAFGPFPPLNDDENLAAVLTYVRQAWGNNAPPVTPEQVQAVRAETSARTAPWTAAELEAVPE